MYLLIIALRAAPMAVAASMAVANVLGRVADRKEGRHLEEIFGQVLTDKKVLRGFDKAAVERWVKAECGEEAIPPHLRQYTIGGVPIVATPEQLRLLGDYLLAGDDGKVRALLSLIAVQGPQ